MRIRRVWAAVLLLPVGDAARGAEPRAERHDDALPPGALARCGTVHWRVPGGAQAVAYSPDGKAIAAASRDLPVVLVFDPATGRPTRYLSWEKGLPRRVSWCPKGLTLAVGTDDGAVHFWDSVGKPQGTASLYRTGAPELAWSPDGSSLFVSIGQRVDRWDPAAGKLAPLFETRGEVLALACSPDGRHVAAGMTGGWVRVRHTADGTAVAGWRNTAPGVTALAYSPDGQHLALAGFGTGASLRDPTTGAILTQFEVAPDLRRLAFTPDGRHLVSGPEHGAAVWALDPPRLIRSVRAGPIMADFALAPDGRALVTAGGSAVRFWELATGRELSPAPGHVGPPTRLAWSPDGRTLATGGPDDARVWDAATGELLGSFGAAPGFIRDLTFTPEGREVVAVIGAGVVGRWDPHRLRSANKLMLLVNTTAVTLSRDGHRVATNTGRPDGGRHGWTVWDATTGRLERSAETAQPLVDVAFSPDGPRLALLEFGTGVVRFAATDGGDPPGRSIRQRGLGTPRQLAYSPDGSRLALCFAPPAVELWDPVDCTFVRRIEWKPSGPALSGKPVCPCAWSADGRLLATAGPDASVRVWEALTGQEVLRLDGRAGPAVAVAFSPDGRRLASVGGDAAALVWDLSPADPPPDGAERLWERLASADAAEAYRAGWALSAAPGPAVGLLRKRLADDRPEAGLVGRLIGDLDSPQFAVRVRATELLADLGSEAALRELLAGPASPEARRRAEAALGRMRASGPSPAAARLFRAVAVLERIGSPEARKALEELAGSDPMSGVTCEAKAAVERLRTTGEGRR